MLKYQRDERECPRRYTVSVKHEETCSHGVDKDFLTNSICPEHKTLPYPTPSEVISLAFEFP